MRNSTFRLCVVMAALPLFEQPNLANSALRIPRSAFVKFRDPKFLLSYQGRYAKNLPQASRVNLNYFKEITK